MIKAGIDTFAIYTPRYVFDLTTLANARGEDPEKYVTGLGQIQMSVPPPGEDIVTMAANAAKIALQDIDVNQIEMLLFATESGIDQSKSAGIFVHELLQLPKRCRVVELKQACYGATAALQLSLSYLREHPDKKILLIASDVARYGLGTVAESSQGAGAIAMVLSINPRVIAFELECGVITESVMDFWRPNYLRDALVDGKYSSKLYLNLLEATWQQYKTLSQRDYKDHDYFCYHIPVPKLVEKAHQHLLKFTGNQHLPLTETQQQFLPSLCYGKLIGNTYTASLYVGLASLLEQIKTNVAGARIGFYSYGSGCVAEYFSGIVQENYHSALHTDYHATLLNTRKNLSYDEYAAFYTFSYPEDGSDFDVPVYETYDYRLVKFHKHKRVYECVSDVDLRLNQGNKKLVA